MAETAYDVAASVATGLGRHVTARKATITRQELPEVGRPSLSVVAVLAELCMVAFLGVVVWVSRATIPRLPDGGKFNQFPTMVGSLCMAEALSLAIFLGVVLFKPMGGALFSLSTDVVVLNADKEQLRRARDSPWAWFFGILGGLFVLRHVVSFVFALFVWLLVGASFAGQPAATGYSSVQVELASSNGWGNSKVLLAEFVVSCIFTLMLVLVVDRYSQGKRVTFHKIPVLALAGVVFGLSFMFAPIHTPVLFPALETGPAVVHSFAKWYASPERDGVSAFPGVAAYASGSDPTVPLATLPHLYAPPFLARYDALQAHAAQESHTTWTRIYGTGRAHIQYNHTATPPEATLQTDNFVRGLMPLKLAGALGGQFVGFLIGFYIRWITKDEPFGEAWTLLSRIGGATKRRMLPTSCGPRNGRV
jgi:hypothetical protein